MPCSEFYVFRQPVLVAVCFHSCLVINPDFLFDKCLPLKYFKSQNSSVKQILQTPPLGIPCTIDIIIHFMFGLVFSSFNFLMYLKNSARSVAVLFLIEFFCVVSETFFKCSFWNTEIFLTWLAGYWYHNFI